MKATFVASHTQKAELLKYYKTVVDVLEKAGFSVFSGSLFEELRSDPSVNPEFRKNWYKESISKIRSSDIVVVEISYPSTANVGHELTFALDSGKPVVALYKEERDPLFLRGITNDKLLIVPYEEDNLSEVLKDAIEYAQEMQDTRFNFFISPKHQNYLDWVSKKKKIPRAVYLRRLIEEDMKKKREFFE